MKKIVPIIIIFLFHSTLYAQVASFQERELFPEKYIYLIELHVENIADAKEALLLFYGESPAEGVFLTGKNHWVFEKGHIYWIEHFDANNNLTYESEYVWEGDLLSQIVKSPVEKDTNPRITTLFYYNEKGLLVEKKILSTLDDEAEVEKTSYVYNRKGQLLRIDGADYTVTYTYKRKRCVKKVISHIGRDVEQEVFYEWNKQGRLIKETYPGYKELSYTYDDNGTLLQITLNAFYQTTVYGPLEAGYDEKGNVESLGDFIIDWKYE